MKDVIKIALGVATGLVIAGIAWLTISAYIAKAAVEQINKTTQNSLIQIQKNAEASTRRQREYQAKLEADRRNAKAQEVQAQQAIVAAEQAAIKLRAAKAEAWEKFFTKSSECENPPTMSIMSNCANIAIRAKRQFEEQWSALHQNGTQ